MLQDFRYALRSLLHTKGWTTVVLVSLMLGIGANTALFSAVNGLLLQTLPVADPHTLVRLKWTGRNDMVRSSSEYGFNTPHQGQDVRSTFSIPTFEAIRAANRTLVDLFAAAPLGQLNVVVNGEADVASSFGVTAAYFRVLGLNTVFGRTLNDEDHQAGAPAAAVISHAFWRKRFGSDPAAVNRVVTINGQAVTIVGVLPASFAGIQRLGASAPDVTLPLSMDSVLNLGQTRTSEATWWWVHMFGRLRPTATLEQVRGNLGGVFQEAARAGMAKYEQGLTAEQRALNTNQRRGNDVPSLLATSGAHGIYDFDSNTSRSATILAVVVVLVLLIVCANVANLLLSRAAARRKELSVRLSVGATRTRLVRQLLTESLVLSGLGGGLGLVLGYWSRPLLPFGQEVPIDWRVFGFVAGLSVVTGIAFGLLPAFRATRVDLAGAMKETSRSVSGTRSRLGKALLVSQVAISLVLVVGAGLFLRTLSNLRAVDIGFNPNNLLIFSINPLLNRYEPDRARQFYQQLQEELAALPGVRSVALTRVALLTGSSSITSAWLPGRSESTNVHIMAVSSRFFQTMEIPVLLGRDFASSDIEGAPKVAVMNETAARTLFPDGSPIGRRFGFDKEKSADVEIVGVIRDTKYNSVRDASPPTVYQPYMQGTPRGMNVILRTAGDPSALIESVRTAVRRVDRELPITNIATQTEQIERRFAQERLFANAYVLFGALALTLASIGLFGLMSYNVSRRTNEIGIRMALGAGRRVIVRMVLRESVLVVAVGIAIGLAVALLAGSLVTTVLYGLAPTDPATLTFAAALIVAVTLAAAYVPARRAARVDPMVALRQD
jgi:predicted permease